MDFVLCEFRTRPDIDLATVKSVQRVQTVWNRDEWELRFVCKITGTIAESQNDDSVGIGLGINNFAALASEKGHSELYPLNCFNQDDYYFSKRLARCDRSDSGQAYRLNQKKSSRRTHYFHALSKHIVQRCVEVDVGLIVIGDLSGIRVDDENGESKDCRMAILICIPGRLTGSRG